MAKQSDSKKRREVSFRHEVNFYTYPKFLFCWPLIVVGYLLWGLDHWAEADSEVLAWVWGVTLLIVLVTVGV